MRTLLLAVLLGLLAAGAHAQLLLPKPELRVDQDCETCPEMVILPNGLYMSRAPVMVSEFRAFVKDTGYRNTDWGCKWNYAGFEQGPRHPATCVTFEAAQLYAGWLSEKTGRTYRVPTGEELTYAVRGGTTTNYWWGQQVGRDRATCLGCGRAFDAKGTTPVDTFEANPFNLLDALGNVWIWTTDCTSADCKERYLLSGGWSSPPSDLRVSKKVFNSVKVPFNTYGFRVVREFE